MGRLPIKAEAATQGIFTASRRGGKLPRSRDVTVFLRQLALLVGAGLTLEGALQTLADDTSKAMSRFANALRSSITAGNSFAEALERYPTLIVPAYIAMVRAGEASGKLDAALTAIVEEAPRQELLNERFNAAIRYPLFLVASAVIILLFFLIYFVPQF